MKRIGLVFFVFLVAARAVALQPCKTPTTGSRPIVVISDLHFGPGMGTDVAAFEDFRWPRALKAFLDALPEKLGLNIDLVIAGDLFEFWQHPTVLCANSSANLGCSADDIGKVAEAAISAHTVELQSIGRFASHGGNHVYVIPGNHDAALLLDNVWNKVAAAIGGTASNVTRVSEGRWASADCRVAVEHGHQIGHDLNRFPDWPRITAGNDGHEYVWKPWGEAFVADQFNHVEKNYPLIDNVLPLTAGLKLYLDEHTIGRDARDVASFLSFNIFRTSWRQKVALNVYSDSSPASKWDVDKARDLGYRLMASAMPRNDPDRRKLLESSDDTWKEVRHVIDERLADHGATSDEEIATLCDLAADYAKEHSLRSNSAEVLAEGVQCQQGLAVAIATALIPERRILTSHVSNIQKTQPKLRYFIYGHTHQYVSPFPVLLESGVSAMVLNDGAFQRLVSMDTLLAAYRRRHKNEVGEKSSALKTSFDDLPPCYSAAIVEYNRGIAVPGVWVWVFGESFRSGTLYKADALGNVCNLR